MEYSTKDCEGVRTLHVCHLRIFKYTQRARDERFWIGINCDINNFVSSCSVCQRMQNANSKKISAIFDKDSCPSFPCKILN